ncbi:MAG TPA: PEP-utilizing enzyme [Candidatus Saccharimonadales bacterium]
MADNKLADLFKTQKSLTEWFEDIKHTNAALLRKEDNEKRERLRVLHEVIDLPFDQPTQFEALELSDTNPQFTQFLEQRGQELCALRLIPKKEGLPKLRMRGKTITDAYAWFKEQVINPADYRADFVPHVLDASWATIFIVNEHGIQGEIIYGGHHQLTQGFHETAAPSIFRYDFKTWSIAPQNDAALEHLKELAQYIHVPNQTVQKQLKNQLNATFVNDYLAGYFETTDSSMGTWFIDYNQSLGNMYKDIVLKIDQPNNAELVTGQTGSPGQATGTVRIVDPDMLNADFPENGILVCAVTTPNYVPLMQKASAIVTDQGGILSHAAIVARELGTPCIVGTGNATSLLKNGEVVTVNADAGTVVNL